MLLIRSMVPQFKVRPHNFINKVPVIVSIIVLNFGITAPMAIAAHSSLNIIDWRNRTTYFGTRPSGANSIAVLVLHHTVTGTAEQTLNVLNKRKLSVHYIVERNGIIYQMVDDEKRAWHAGDGTWGNFRNLNDISIGIEIVNWGDEPFPNVQEEAVAALSQVIVTKWDISPKNIVSHADFAPSRKSDVSGYFDYKSFYETLGIYSGLYTSNLAVSDQVTMLLQPSTAYNSKVKSIQQQLYNYGYDIKIDGYYGTETGNAVQAFNRHFCPEIFIKESVVPPHTGQLIHDPKNRRWYGISQERMDFLLANSRT